MEETFDKARLLELSARSCEEALSSAEFVELESLLLESVEAREAFRDYTNVHVTLAKCYGAEGLAETSAETSGEVIEISEAAVVRMWPRAVLATAAVFAVGLGAYFLIPLEEAGSGGPTVEARVDLAPEAPEKGTPATAVVEADGVVGTPVIAREEGPQNKLNDAGRPKSRPQPRPQAQRVPPRPGMIAQVEALSGARWAEGSKQPKVNEWVGASTLTLEKGLARIVFLDGVSTTLRGPVEIELLSGNAARLKQGELVARVPLRAVGFTVRTNSVNVVDLGTAFGMSASAGGDVEVQVFQGEVELVSPEDAPGAIPKPKRVRTGQGYRAKIAKPSSKAGSPAKKRVTLEAVEANASPYQRMASYNSGVIKTNGPVRFVTGRPSEVIGKYENNKNLFVFRERAGLWLEEPVEVDIVAPGNYLPIEGEAKETVAGIPVRSYLLHFNPVGKKELGRAVKASVSFDQPVVGIIYDGERLKESDENFVGDVYRLGGAGGRSMEAPTEEALANAKRTGNKSVGDRVILSGDRKTVRVDWKASMGMDQVRVIVRDEG